MLRFVKGYFKKDMEKELEVLSFSAKSLKRKEWNAQLRELVEDLEAGKEVSPRFSSWSHAFKHKILPPKNRDLTYSQMLELCPQKFFSYIVFMADYLVKASLKSFQIFPVRDSAVPKYVRFDSSSLVSLFFTEHKSMLSKDITANRHMIFSKFFDLNNQAFKRKGYLFDYSIQTDGIGVSLSFLENAKAAKSLIIKEKKAESRRKAANAYKDLEDSEKKILKDTKKEVNQEEKKTRIIVDTLVKETNRKNFLKLSKEDKNLKSKFPYIDYMNADSLSKLKEEKLVFIDPGKRVLFYMIDKEFNPSNEKENSKEKAKHRIRYTNKRRINETKRFIYRQEIQKRRDRTGVSKAEEILSNYNKKTCDFNEYKVFLFYKFQVLGKTFKEYCSPIYRKLRWYRYINEQRADMRLYKEIREKFGQDPLLIMGDWSSNNRLRFISTPGIGMKNKLAKEFRILQMDEYKTSMLDNRTNEVTKNLIVSNKDGITKKELHAVLTSQMENKRECCINRDLNSVLNMRKIVDHFITTGTRLEAFKRPKKETLEEKTVEPVEFRPLQSNDENLAGEKILPEKLVTVLPKVQNVSKVHIKILPTHTKIGSNSQVQIPIITPIIKSKRDTNRFDNGKSETVAVEFLPLLRDVKKSAGELKILSAELPLLGLPNVQISKDQEKSYVSNCREYSDHKGDGQTIQKRNKIILKPIIRPKN